jgi:hypothetical protein
MSLNFDDNSISRKKVSHYRKIVKMCQFYSDSFLFFCNQLYIRILIYCEAFINTLKLKNYRDALLYFLELAIVKSMT